MTAPMSVAEQTEGVAARAAVPLADRAPALQEAVTAVSWRAEIDPAADAADRIAAGLAAPAIEITRTRKGREVTEDVRPVVRFLNMCDDTVVEMELNTQPRSAKPSEILAAFGGLNERRAVRTHQWIERDGARLEPLDADMRIVGLATEQGGFAAESAATPRRPRVHEVYA